jgi:hypothetical protein
MSNLVVAFSGGKDSTALALRLAESGESAALLFNVVGGEFADLAPHVKRVAELTGFQLIPTLPPKGGLHDRIRQQNCIPNQFQRWCTRELKIEPTVAYLEAHPGSTLCVGLRADEVERQGIYGDVANYRYPLREWGWGLADVKAYLEQRGVCVPRRTNCPLCYGQRLAEWHRLWREHPELFAEGEAIEAATGHTFRAPSRDTWPVGLKELRASFETGDTPRGVVHLPMFDEYDYAEDAGVCRVCR